MKRAILITVIMYGIIIVGCERNPNIENINISKYGNLNEVEKNTSTEPELLSHIKILEDFTIELSKRLGTNIDAIKSFKLTEIGNDRKVPVEVIVQKLGMKEDFEKLKSYFRNETFVLIIWEEWYKKWLKGEVKPYFTFDPLEDENQIKVVKLYKNGKLAKEISIENFNDYPILVLSPEWWEGDIAILRTAEGETEKEVKDLKSYYLIPYIDGLYISRCFDPYFWGSCGAMEIYVVTWNDSQFNTRDTTDFAEVDYPNRWYLPTCDDISCDFLQGFHRRVFYHPVTSDTFYFKIMERDGGLRFNDDFVGYYMEHRYGGPHYIPGSASRIWIYIDLPY